MRRYLSFWLLCLIPTLSMFASKQLKSAEPIESESVECYLIGSFNQWQVPDLNSANGAILMLKEIWEEDNTIFFHEQSELSPGTYQMGVCKFDRTNGTYQYLEMPSMPPFTLYNYEDDPGDDIEMIIPYLLMNAGNWIDEPNQESNNLTLKDWQGGNLYTQMIIYTNGKISFNISGSTSSPTVAKPGPLYVLTSIEGKRSIEPMTLDPQLGYSYNFFTKTPVKGFAIAITTENSLNPAPENCWGISKSLQDAGYTKEDMHKVFELEKGGYPLYYNFEKFGTVSVTFRFPESLCYVSLSDYEQPIESEKLYICGNVATAPDGLQNNFLEPSESNREIYDEHFSLTNKGDGIFEGVWYVPEMLNDALFPNNLPQFRFFTDLLGWWHPEVSLGSAYQDFYCEPIDILFNHSDHWLVEGGRGNFGLYIEDSWPGHWVKFSVNLNDPSVSFTLLDSGINELDAERNGSERWYNLQGIPVDAPSNGLYIRVTDGRSQLHLVK